MGIKILLVHSLPNNESNFRFDRKGEALARRLAPHARGGHVALTIAPATCIERLGQLLARVRPHVLHVVCHAAGTPRALLFEDRHGRRQPLTPERLRALFDEVRVDLPQLAVFEACTSRPIAEALVTRGVPYAIGMEHDVNPHVGTPFFASLYATLARGHTLASAFTEARRDLELLAPGAAAIPVLCRSPAAPLDRLISPALPHRAELASIEPDAEHEHAFLSSALVNPGAFTVGQEAELATLTELASERGVVQVRGDAGTGKTLLLSRWLEQQAAWRWRGAARVFAWSFDPSHTGPGCGDVHAFLDEALFFFGGHEQGALHRTGFDSAWLRGMRVGRLLRHEPSLLILDGVPALPAPAGSRDLAPPEQMLHPGLAALVREIAAGSECFCVLSMRTQDGRLARADGFAAPAVDLAPLPSQAGADLLWHHGMVDDEAALRSLAEVLQGHPLALRIAARNFAAASDAHTGLRRALPDATALTAALQAAATTWPAGESASVLAALASGVETLDSDELAAILDRRRRYDALRPLVRGGLIDVAQPGGSIRLSHRALVPALRAAAPKLPVSASDALIDRARDGLTAGANTMTDLAGYARLIPLYLRAGRRADAIALYMREICRFGSQQYQRSYITRDLGLIAEDLEILAHFFTDASEVPNWHRPLGDTLEDAFLLHRAALALRHLGQLAASHAPMQAAWRLYERHGDLERAATCANDCAETLVLLAQVARGAPHYAADALAAATAAVNLADAFAARPVSAEPFAHAVAVVRTLCLATLGHVHHCLGDIGPAQRAFDDAQALARATFHSTLASRPGFQHWHFLLDRLAQAPDWSDPDVTTGVAALARLLDGAQEFHNRRDVAAVSRGLEQLARGRLATLCAEHSRPYPVSEHLAETRPASTIALLALTAAVDIFRANQHIWMLPGALAARARLYQCVLNDPVNAEIDHAEAARLTELWAGARSPQSPE